ncbi:hydrogenase maturation protease [Corynebacterium sp. 13CS0277]|nr:hydrogenase maturation protease [Corynebacterium sp. 13CS0277]
MPAGVPLAGWDTTPSGEDARTDTILRHSPGGPRTPAPAPREGSSPAAAAGRPTPATDAREGHDTASWLHPAEEDPAGQPVEFHDGGTAGMELLPLIQDADCLLLLDAVRGPGDPGTVVELHGDQIPRLLNTSLSPHQVGLLDLLAAARLLGHEPRSVAVVGIVAESCELGVGLSAPVARSIDEAARRAAGILRSWQDAQAAEDMRPV